MNLAIEDTLQSNGVFLDYTELDNYLDSLSNQDLIELIRCHYSIFASAENRDDLYEFLMDTVSDNLFNGQALRTIERICYLKIVKLTGIGTTDDLYSTLPYVLVNSENKTVETI
jgi:hypothetical protein